MGEQMTAAIYVRTSTDDQHGRAQLAQLEAAMGARGIKTWEVYQDIGHSGGKDTRPALDRLVRDARAGHVGEVYFTAFDRLARNVEHFCRQMAEWSAAGLRVVSLREGLDYGTAFGRAIAQILAAVAELELELIRQRTREGIKAKRAKGMAWGRPPDAALLASLPDARARIARGESVVSVARRLGVPRSTLRSAMAKNPP